MDAVDVSILEISGNEHSGNTCTEDTETGLQREREDKMAVFTILVIHSLIVTVHAPQCFC